MGLFSSKKKTYVSSVAYNMAGEEDGRVNYMKTLVIQNIVSETNASMADSIKAGELNGPTMDLRAFYRWAKNNYDTVGLPTASINGAADIDIGAVTDLLPTMAGKEPYIITLTEQPFDYSLWAEKYIIDNHPELWDTEWGADIDEDDIITITYVDNSTESFPMTGFNKNADYLYILYAYTDENTSDPPHTGSTVTLAPGEDFPPTTGWTTVTDTHPTVNQDLDTTITVTKSYSDGRPDEVTTTTTTRTESFEDRNAHFTKVDPPYQDPDASNTRFISRAYDLYFTTNYSIIVDSNTDTTSEVIGGVTVTTVTETDTENLDIVHQYREDYQDTIILEYTDLSLWLYEIGSGLNSTIENMIANPTPVEGDFFPCIPVRYENKFISDTYRPELWEQTQKAYKKALKKKIGSLISDLEDNEDLKDIDFAFIHFGVSLNVQDTQAKKYLFKFFTRLQSYQKYDEAAFNNFISRLDAYNDAIDNWDAVYDPILGHYVYPPIPTLPQPKNSTIKVKSEGTEETNFDIRLHWNYINTVSGLGLGKAGAKKGDLWFVVRPTVVWNQYVVSGGGGGDNGSSTRRLVKAEDNSMENIRLYWQVDTDEYVYLDIYGLKHQNVVYNGKSVYITSKEALEDEEESGFVVPMHYLTLKEMSLASANQMCTACVWIIFNCYKIVKQKWYQTGIFRIFLIIAIAIVSVVFTGGAGIGILGANLSVGTSLGFSGLTAAIVGSVANALAAVVLTSVIQYFSTRIFGEQFGALIGSILSFVVMNVAISFQMSGQFAFNWGDMMKAENLLKLTDSLSQGYSAYMQGVISNKYQATQQLVEDYQEQSKEISKKYSELIGYSNIAITSINFTGSGQLMQFEPSSTFLKRTLMTGTDIAQTSLDMLTDYVDLNLTLPSVYG